MMEQVFSPAWSARNLLASKKLPPESSSFMGLHNLHVYLHAHKQAHIQLLLLCRPTSCTAEENGLQERYKYYWLFFSATSSS